ncbi:hypothetical protein Scep_021425 [Stephania cephalantha]|uniref:Uncharacterized protein n=1 Tax=Stephania cephalantha TaxID=152367 RepID=A0AAP0I1E6_9MAGN
MHEPKPIPVEYTLIDHKLHRILIKRSVKFNDAAHNEPHPPPLLLLPLHWPR